MITLKSILTEQEKTVAINGINITGLPNEIQIIKRALNDIASNIKKIKSQLKNITILTPDVFKLKGKGKISKKDYGFYYKSSDTIFINGLQTTIANNLRHIIKHEIGHIVEDLIPKTKRYLDWEGLWFKMKKTTNMAQRSSSEAFAEAFVIFYSTKRKMLDNQIIIFFKNMWKK